MRKLAMQGDDGSRPSHSVLVSAKVIDGKVRVVIDRVKGGAEDVWEADWPVTFKDFDRVAFDAMSEDHGRALGEVIWSTLSAQLHRHG